MLPAFDLTIPASLDEALGALGEGAAPLAGGTNLLVDMRAGTGAPARLVGIDRLDGLRRIETANGRVAIGALTTVTDVMRHPDMPKLGPSMVASARVFGGQMVRNTATVAGNICSDSPAADLLPPLLALDADVTLTSRSGSRTLALADFYHGYKKMERRPDELLTEMSWPVPAETAANLFYKLARRKGDAITIVGVAVAMGVEAGKCRGVRIALGSVAPIVKRALAAEELLEGEAPTPESIEAASRTAMEEVSPIGDVRASAGYRSHCVHVLTRRLLTRAWERLAPGGSQA